MGRYARQRPLLGADGQARLGTRTVSIVGVDPSADVAALYLVAAGVGACVFGGNRAPLLAVDPEAEITADGVGTAVDPSAVELPEEILGSDPPIPELLGAVAAAEALMLFVEETDGTV